jgi:Leucine Rich repeat
MNYFTSASLDKASCLNLRYQHTHLKDYCKSPITSLRLGPVSITTDLVQHLPLQLEILEWDLGNEPILNDEALFSLFRRSSIRQLSLKFRNSNVVQSLKRTLQYAEHLKILDMSGNFIGDEGVSEIQDSIIQSNIESLKVGLNCITDVGALHLANMISHPSCGLLTLDLNCNFIGNSGGHALAAALKKNTRLIGLILFGNAQLSCSDEFVACLKVNCSLCDWNLQRTHMTVCEVALINYWLMLNKSGRRILTNDKLPSSVWPHFLERQKDSKHDIIFYFLSQKPELMLTQAQYNVKT